MTSVGVMSANGFLFFVDEELLPRLEGRTWSTYVMGRSRTMYVMTAGRPRIYLHRLLTSAPAGMDVDHRDGDGLNNRISNLRVCAHRLNLANQRRQTRRSMPKGVHLNRNGTKYVAKIKVDGEQRHLGTFDSVAAAASAYDAAALESWGEYARPNGVAA